MLQLCCGINTVIYLDLLSACKRRVEDEVKLTISKWKGLDYQML